MLPAMREKHARMRIGVQSIPNTLSSQNMLATSLNRPGAVVEAAEPPAAAQNSPLPL